jgi:aspartate aminotransferase
MFEIEEVRNRTFVARSFSKGYSMTGFRIGYVAASSRMIAALSKIQSHLTGNVCTFAQYGALAALALDSGVLAARQNEMQRKRDRAYQYASRLFRCKSPQGAFYLFPDVSSVLRNGESAQQLATRFLKEAHVAVVAGEAFGMAQHIRISFAVSEDALKNGFERIAEVL